MRGPFSTPITPLPGSLFHADPQTHPNHAIAWSTLLSYVNGTWAERFPDRPPPENEEERVTMFFAGEGDEYVIAEADVETDTTLH
jgi:hypothetical protein